MGLDVKTETSEAQAIYDHSFVSAGEKKLPGERNSEKGTHNFTKSL